MDVSTRPNDRAGPQETSVVEIPHAIARGDPCAKRPLREDRTGVTIALPGAVPARVSPSRVGGDFVPRPIPPSVVFVGGGSVPRSPYVKEDRGTEPPPTRNDP